jgi:hypothetical protein
VFRKYYFATPAAARDVSRRATSAADRSPPRGRRQMKTPLDKILWGNTQSMSFAEIDWPSDERERPALFSIHSHKRAVKRRRSYA